MGNVEDMGAGVTKRQTTHIAKPGDKIVKKPAKPEPVKVKGKATTKKGVVESGVVEGEMSKASGE